jgi:hypothetical protein
MIDVRDPTQPQEVGGCDTPGTADDVKVGGNYVYVADWEGGMRVMEVRVDTDPPQLQEIGAYESSSWVEGITVTENYVYVAQGELVMVDVRDPTQPRKVGSYSTPGRPRRCAVIGNYVYVADEWRDLRVIEVNLDADPPQLREVGAYEFIGSVYDVAVEGDYAYLAAGESGLRVVDVRDPTHLQEIEVYDTPGSASHVAVAGGYIYLGDYGSGFWALRFSPDQATSGLEIKTTTISYPNPFNPECYIPLNAKSRGRRTKCKIYNILGQLVREIEISNLNSQLSNFIYWDGKNEQGVEVPSGVYFYEVPEAGVKQMVILR